MGELVATCRKWDLPRLKSDADPNLYYLVVGNEPLILVLCVDDMFLTGSSRLIGGLQEESSHGVRHERFGTNALFPGVGSLAVKGGDLP